MEVGIGLPSTIPGVEREPLLDWARTADERGFSSLATLDRLVYPNFEPLVALAAAAAVTERARLATAILLAPLRNAAVLAKQAATLDWLSAGRLSLGLAVGAREDDFTASGSDFRRRGRVFDAQLAEMKAIWDGEDRGIAGPIGPPPARAGGPELLVGGTADAEFERAARYGNGWIAGAGGAERFAAGAAKARRTFEKAGRIGPPRLASIAYYSLGPEAEQNANWYIDHYYGFLGPYAERMAESVATTPEQVRGELQAFSDAGCDELILFPCSVGVEQVELLAEAALR
jgi:alkanesulfonate monooxygenase SsuD/methylene tetrahydromethanopterin reductase-like flavin-dependent oxidoreductase (luciferase family)